MAKVVHPEVPKPVVEAVPPKPTEQKPPEQKQAEVVEILRGDLFERRDFKKEAKP